MLYVVSSCVICQLFVCSPILLLCLLCVALFGGINVVRAI